jgi:hypothetical protein
MLKYVIFSPFLGSLSEVDIWKRTNKATTKIQQSINQLVCKCLCVVVLTLRTHKLDSLIPSRLLGGRVDTEPVIADASNVPTCSASFYGWDKFFLFWKEEKTDPWTWHPQLRQ